MMLRAGKNPVHDDHPHSYMTRALYKDVIEADIVKDARMDRMISWASLHGHPNADIAKAVSQLKMYYIDALSTITYLTGGRSGEDAVTQERREALERYRAYRDSVLQGQAPAARTKPLDNIKMIEGNNV